MKKYEDYSASDFVMDEYFQQWIKNPSHEADEFWEHWMKLHPRKKNDLLLARKLLTAFDFKKTTEDNIHADALLGPDPNLHSAPAGRN